MICNPVSKVFLQRTRSKFLKKKIKIQPSSPIRLPVVKPEHTPTEDKSKNPLEPLNFKNCLFNRIKTPTKRHVFRIKDLTTEFKRNVSEFFFKDLENSTKRTLKPISSLMSFESSQKSLRFQANLYSSQKVTNRVSINPFDEIIISSHGKPVIKKVIRSISPCILREQRNKKLPSSFLLIRPLRNKNM